ncbi:hypothetical protein L1S24_01585 [Clostridium sporogenes]|uniref:hypothetical protein n=1 Tax=Clostridium sporogenes TaxID=1509 RepID=UPI001F3497C8|nr:hypothetical protein [Clostridium sporogenes]MCF4015838.1 hypothetical protein [Clostridium sporogenes]
MQLPPATIQKYLNQYIKTTIGGRVVRGYLASYDTVNEMATIIVPDRRSPWGFSPMEVSRLDMVGIGPAY